MRFWPYAARISGRRSSTSNSSTFFIFRAFAAVGCGEDAAATMLGDAGAHITSTNSDGRSSHVILPAAGIDGDIATRS